MKVFDFISKHYIAIIVCLFTLLLGKSCQSCTRKNEIMYNKYEYASKIDSLKYQSDFYHDSIISLNNRIQILTNELDGCKTENIRLKDNYDNMRQINVNIQKTNNKLVNKLTEKEL